MARKQKQVVRVVLPDGMNQLTSEVRQLVECLRYAGIATVHRDNDDGLCFDLHCPSGLMDKPWAEMNAKRMRSFTYNAVAAPGTAHLDEEPPTKAARIKVSPTATAYCLLDNETT